MAILEINRNPQHSFMLSGIHVSKMIRVKRLEEKDEMDLQKSL